MHVLLNLENEWKWDLREIFSCTNISTKTTVAGIIRKWSAAWDNQSHDLNPDGSRKLKMSIGRTSSDLHANWQTDARQTVHLFVLLLQTLF